MQDLRERLTAWSKAGLLEVEQAAAIERFEAQLAAAGERTWPPATYARDDAARRRVAPAEAIGYVGAALAVGAVGLMLGDIWSGFTATGRLTLIGLLTVLLFGAGVALRATTSAPVQRLTSVLLVAGVIGATWFAAVLGDEVLALRWDQVELLVAGVAAATAIPTYLWRRRGLPQLAAFASVLALAFAVLPLLSSTPARWVNGLVVTTIGLAWLLASLGGWLPPLAVSGVLGGATALLGMQIAGTDWMGEATTWPWLLAGVLLAAGLIGLSLRRDTFHHLVVGSLGLFVFVPQVVFELFGDAIGGPATMLVIGLLLVVLAVGVGRAGREVRGSRSDARPPDQPPGPRPPAAPATTEVSAKEVSGR